VLPILFDIYISDLFFHLEPPPPKRFYQAKDETVTALSFVDDVAWVVEGEDINQCVQRMQLCPKRVKEWSVANAVEFYKAKIEAVLSSQKRNHQGGSVKMKVKVDEDVYVNFKSKATRWLGVFLDRKLNFQNHHNVNMAKARKNQGKVCSITGKM
jgi:hypothetical protein